jgi:hypothetical protein
MEVAIVVVSVMLSGTEPLHDGAIKIGEHCHDPLRSTRQITDYTDPIVADHPGSERDFYENFCHDPRLANKDACESDLGRFPAVTGTTAATGRCQWGARAVTTMEVRLAVLVLGHALMALYFMNPLSLMSGELWCTPYRDQAQTDSRTSLCNLGYPYLLHGAPARLCYNIILIALHRGSMTQ